MISFAEKEVIRLNNKTKQVQVRLSPEKHRQLKSKLALEDSKLVDFFNDAASAYLSNPKQYKEMIKRILGGTQNG